MVILCLTCHQFLLTKSQSNTGRLAKWYMAQLPEEMDPPKNARSNIRNESCLERVATFIN